MTLSLSLVAGLFVMSGEAHAVSITSHSCPQQTGNTMRYDCTVELSEASSIRIGTRQTSVGGAWNWSDWHAGQTIDITLYNFEPGQAHEYQVFEVGGASSGATALPATPTLPADLDDLNLSITRNTGARTNYVLFDTPDCKGVPPLGKQYLVAVEVEGAYIAWYQDVSTVTGASQLTGWSYTDDQTILLAMNQGEFWEWDLAGEELAHETHWGSCSGATGDAGPCPHHDLYRTSGTGKTYVATGSAYTGAVPGPGNDFDAFQAENESDPAWIGGFVNDGVRVYASGYGTWNGYTLIDDLEFDPDTDGGPDPACLPYWPNTFEINACDWTHVNSVAAKQIGGVELLVLSLREWSQVMQYRPDTDDIQWSINGEDPTNYGTLTLLVDPTVSGSENEASFLGQHHVTYYGGGLLMFDNRKDAQLQDPAQSTNARAIQTDVDSGAGTATIVRSWAMRTQTTHAGLDCRQGLGSAVIVQGSGGDHLLATCGHDTSIQELDQYDGSMTRDPVLEISLDSSTAYDFCKTGTDPTQDDHSFYRAYPLVTLGEF